MVQRLWSPSDVGDDFPRVVPEYEFDEEDGRVNHLRVEDFSAPFVDDGEEGWTGLAQLVKPPPRVGEVRPEGVRKGSGWCVCSSTEGWSTEASFSECHQSSTRSIIDHR